jgi:predicted Zn-dependent protease
MANAKMPVIEVQITHAGALSKDRKSLERLLTVLKAMEIATGSHIKVDLQDKPKDVEDAKAIEESFLESKHINTAKMLPAMENAGQTKNQIWIHVTDHPLKLGEAQARGARHGNSILFSTHLFKKLEDDLTARGLDPVQAERAKIYVHYHELGHAFGLPHCKNEGCAMEGGDVHDFHNPSTTKFCDSCAANAKKHVENHFTPRPLKRLFG